MFADARQIDETVDSAQQVIGRHVILDAEAVEQRFLHHLSLTHHRRVIRLSARTESGLHPNRKRDPFSGIRQKPVARLPPRNAVVCIHIGQKRIGARFALGGVI